MLLLVLWIMLKIMKKAILVDVIDPETPKIEAEKRLEEIESLVSTYGGISIDKIIQKKSLPDYETYIGKGKVREIKLQADTEKAELVIVNNILKPRQIYALQDRIDKRSEHTQVWDRVDLILKIFSKHAKSTEAKLQIALASIKHMGPRIFGMGQDLMQQTGAIGLRSGQGETNTELMKRHLSKQEQNIRKKLEHYQTISAGHRKQRRRKNLKTVALVGYTNAGKSSLLNALTNKGAYVADQLFATLSTRIGSLFIPPKHDPDATSYQPGKNVLISDTIGFIRDLPPSLIEAFTSTLAETIDADLLLHVIDIADPDIHRNIRVVEKILTHLGLQDKPKFYVFNKIDLIDHDAILGEETPHLSIGCCGEVLTTGDSNSCDHHDDPDHPDHRPKSLMKAGPEAIKSLGWHDAEELARQKAIHELHAYVQPEKLLKRYRKFTPLFVSAHAKLNLDSLIEAIDDQL